MALVHKYPVKRMQSSMDLNVPAQILSSKMWQHKNVKTVSLHASDAILAKIVFNAWLDFISTTVNV